MTRGTDTRVMMITSKKVFMGTQPVASLHWRSTAKDTTETIVTYTMSSAAEMHTTKLKAGAKIGSVKSKNNALKGTMITTILITTNLTGSGCCMRDTSQEASRHTPET
jgi:hypothetical protein